MASLVPKLQAYVYNRGLYQMLDVMLITLALVLAQELRFSGDVPPYFVQGLRMFLLPAIASTLVFNTLFGLYRRLWSSAGAYDAVVLGQAALLNIGLLTILTLFWPSGQPVPLSVPIFGGLLYLCASTLVRFRWRFMQSLLPSRASDVPTKRVLLVGAGRTGETFARHLRSGGRHNEFEVVAFVDDDPRKHGLLLQGVPVIGGREQIPETVALYHIDLIVIAAHAITGLEFRSLLDVCNETSAQVKVLPDLIGHLRDQQRTPLLRDVSVQDLLGRRPVEIDDEGCRALLSGATVLVTGAAGSIGSEICRQTLAFGPKRLVMLDNNESGLYDLQIELAPKGSLHVQQEYIIASITDHSKMTRIFEQYRPTVVFHAAAYKHVPLMEAFPEEAVRVNIGGTYVLTELAHRYNVERFVLISTDKAVEPQNVMGATKRVGELLTLSGSKVSRTKFTAVRFGNVLNSRGSVVPTFEKQLDMGGPLTVTHPDMRRFFMSIPEAVSLVIQAATLTTGNDLFMLEMGEEISIAHLARRMIRLRGLRVDQDVDIKYTGVRPGEKLREVLSATQEQRQPTEHPAIYRLLGSSGIGRAALIERIHDLINDTTVVNQETLRQKIFDTIAGSEGHTLQPTAKSVAVNDTSSS